MSVVEEPAESLATVNATGAPPWTHWVYEFVAAALMVPLVVVMLRKLRERPA